MKEETDLDVEFKGIFAVTNDVFVQENKHYITLFSLCAMKDPNAVPVVSIFSWIRGRVEDKGFWSFSLFPLCGSSY